VGKRKNAFSMLFSMLEIWFFVFSFSPTGGEDCRTSVNHAFFSFSPLGIPLRNVWYVNGARIGKGERIVEMV
jgi:hypothetical protein